MSGPEISLNCGCGAGKVTCPHVQSTIWHRSGNRGTWKAMLGAQGIKYALHPAPGNDRTCQHEAHQQGDHGFHDMRPLATGMTSVTAPLRLNISVRLIHTTITASGMNRYMSRGLVSGHIGMLSCQ